MLQCSKILYIVVSLLCAEYKYIILPFMYNSVLLIYYSKLYVYPCTYQLYTPLDTVDRQQHTQVRSAELVYITSMAPVALCHDTKNT